MEETITNFHKQFQFDPVVENVGKLIKADKFAVGGMGGSHLGAGLFSILRPDLQICVHRDYGLPNVSDVSGRLFIGSSYSGNTEETLDFARSAYKKNFNLAVTSVGGELLEFARENDIPFVQIPDTHIQPRSALGFSVMALAKLMGDEDLLKDLTELRNTLKPEELREAGRKLSDNLRSSVPIIYSSRANRAIAYNWKIKMNETGKIPAFFNVFPELNHNEMTGFDTIETTEGLSRRFHFIFLSDEDDHPQTRKRMKITRELYERRGLRCAELALWGHTKTLKVFTSLTIADWTALHLSRIYGTEAAEVPMVEEFKKLIKSA